VRTAEQTVPAREAERRPPPAAEAAGPAPGPGTPAAVLRMQRTVGNAQVRRMLAQPAPLGPRGVRVQRQEAEEGPGVLATVGGGMMGEWNEDPTFGMIGVDLAFSLVPVVDQVSDARDLTAHLYYMTSGGQHDQPMRWVGLAFSLIGVVPEVGSVVKSASKVLIKGAREALAHVGEILRAMERVVPGISDVGRLQRYIADNWDAWVALGKQRWSDLLGHAVRLLRLSGAGFTAEGRRLLDALETVRARSSGMLDAAFEWVRRQVDEALTQLRERVGREGAPDAPPLESALETQGRLTGEAHPEWLARPQPTTPLPQQTRTEGPWKSLGGDTFQPSDPARAIDISHIPQRRMRLESLLETLSGQMRIELHHAWPVYLRGLVEQTLLPLRLAEHKEVHRVLVQWKGGIFDPDPRKGQKYTSMDLRQVMAELRAFYTAHFPEYLEAFERSAAETLEAIARDAAR
jgi:hypothetical protein